MKIKQLLFRNSAEIIVISLGLIFSVFLMFSTFSSGDGEIMISSKAWSDFASHIPLIRSFSFGFNFPPEYPIFSGEPIKYHFLFYAFVGFLEKIGLRIDWALNLPSSVTFFILVLSIYFFAKKIFKSSTVGVLSIIFFLFSGSLGFLEFFKIHPISTQTLNDIYTTTSFSSFGPYDNTIVSAFWNLNIYTNQRHLAASISFLLLIVYFLLRPILNDKKVDREKNILMGIALGLFFYFHTAVFLMIILIVGGLFIFFPKIRRPAFIILLLGSLIALPQYIYLQGASSNFQIIFNPGYLIADKFTFLNFIHYWLHNFGLHTFLMAIGFIIANKTVKKIFICFFILFIIGNTLQFTPDMGTNHKFFNIFMTIGIMYSSYALVSIWRKRFIGKSVVVLSIFFLTLSGIIDIFPLYNDRKITLLDYEKNRTIAWIINKTPGDSVFLNNTYLYNPASLAGRKIVMGWPYFSWGAGYDSVTRDELRKKMLRTNSIEEFCKLSQKISVDYAIIHTINQDENSYTNIVFFENNFKKLFYDDLEKLEIYELKNKCNNEQKI